MFVMACQRFCDPCSQPFNKLTVQHISRLSFYQSLVGKGMLTKREEFMTSKVQPLNSEVSVVFETNCSTIEINPKTFFIMLFSYNLGPEHRSG